MKNKMKDYEAKYEECQKIAKEYFTKELEKNLVQHKTNERIMRYKLEVYEKKNSFHLWQSNKYRGIAPR